MLSDKLATEVRNVEDRGDSTRVEVVVKAVDIPLLNNLSDGVAETRARARALVAVGPTRVGRKSVGDITAGELNRFTEVVDTDKFRSSSGNTKDMLVTVDVNS